MTANEIKLRMESILDLAEKEKRNLTDQEQVEFSGLELELKKNEIIEAKPKRSIPLGKLRVGEGTAQ